jgi:hypothetical protein
MLAAAITPGRRRVPSPPQPIKTAERTNREPVWLYVAGRGTVLGRCRIIYDMVRRSGLDLSGHMGWSSDADPQTELFPDYWASRVESEPAPPWPGEE